MEKKYDMLCLTPAKLTEEEAAEIIDTIRKTIEKHGGTIAQDVNLGRRKLQYAINKYRHGIYHSFIFAIAPTSLIEIEKELKVVQGLLRFQTISYDPRWENVKVREEESSAEGQEPAEKPVSTLAPLKTAPKVEEPQAVKVDSSKEPAASSKSPEPEVEEIDSAAELVESEPVEVKAKNQEVNTDTDTKVDATAEGKKEDLSVETKIVPKDKKKKILLEDIDDIGDQIDKLDKMLDDEL